MEGLFRLVRERERRGEKGGGGDDDDDVRDWVSLSEN